MCLVTLAAENPRKTVGASFEMCGRNFPYPLRTETGSRIQEFRGANLVCLDHGMYSLSELFDHLALFRPAPEVVVTIVRWSGAYEPQYTDYSAVMGQLIDAGVLFIGDLKQHGVIPMYDHLGLSRPPGHPEGKPWDFGRIVLAENDLMIIENG